jgi:hypothetical protein
MVYIRSKCLWLSVFVAWAGAWSARGDVLVMRDGRLLLGEIRAVNGSQVVLALGAAGSVTVDGTAILASIPCPDSERPDTFLKAARRARGQGLLQPAAACYEKSIEVEPGTAAAARTELAALRREMTVRAATRVTNTVDAKRAEAQRLIAEGERELRGARMAQRYDTGQLGPTAKDITMMGEFMAKAAEEKIARGKALLADFDAPAPEKVEDADASAVPASGPNLDWLVLNWPWVVGSLLGVILLLHFVRRSFFG